MGQDTTTQQQSGGPSTDEITPVDEEIEEIEIPQNKSLGDKINVIFEKFACTGMGQMVLERGDRVLKILEETAKWSLPQDDSETKLERPLPWMFFIPLIAWLRFIRFWLSFGSVMVGGSSVTPEAMVYNIQIKRRRLRAIRVPGLRATRRQESDSGAMLSSGGNNKTLFGKLSSLFGSAVCRPGQHRDVPARRVFGPGDKSKPLDDSTTERSSVKRPRDDDSADLNLTVDQMLNKYANEDSDDDSDYVPNADEDEGSGSSSSESITSSEETEKENTEKPKAATKDDSKNEQTSLDHSVVEVKENGGPKHRPMPKPYLDIKLEPISDADSGSEQVKTPRDPKDSEQVKTQRDPKDSEQVKATREPKGSANGEGHKTSTEVAVQQQQKPKESLQTPPLKQHLSVAQEAEAKQKATPGHETAASLKPTVGAKNAVAPKTPPREKCYRTITTQTAIEEYDWSIIVKTEISHRKKPHSSPVVVPKLENSPDQLTPASSTEDIFYSPIGSPQDFHSIFHPVPLVKVSPLDVAHSTPKDGAEEHDENSASETHETNPNQKKTTNHKQAQHQPQHQPQQHHNNKNRNKNRR